MPIKPESALPPKPVPEPTHAVGAPGASAAAGTGDRSGDGAAAGAPAGKNGAAAALQAAEVPENPQAPAPQAAPTHPPAAAAPQPARQGRRGRLLLVLLLIVVASLGYGTYWWTTLRGTLSTDDASVDARIISVAARVAERVDEVLASEGDVVQAGQTLTRFARDKLDLLVQAARADLRAAAALLQEARSGSRVEEVEVARAEVTVHEVNLALQETEWQRAQALGKVRALSAQDLERRRAAVATARSELEVSRRRLTLLLAGRRPEQIEQAEAALALARARLLAAQADVDDAEVRAPVSGTVARRMVDPGEVVQKGQALFQIVDSEQSWVVANLEEGQIGAVREGQAVRIWLDAYPGREFKGRVGPQYAATLSRFSLLPSSSASGSFIKVTQRVPVRIDWEPQALPPMYPGLNVMVRITLALP